MGVIRAKLIKEYNGTPAGEYIQVLEQRYKEMIVTGHFAEEDQEVAEAKKKPKRKEVAQGAEPSE